MRISTTRRIRDGMYGRVGITEQLAAIREVPLRIVDSHRYTTRLALERVLAALGLLVVALPMLAVAVLVKLDSLGPVLHRQVQVGRFGQLIAVVQVPFHRCWGGEGSQDSPARSAGQYGRPIFGQRRHLESGGKDGTP